MQGSGKVLYHPTKDLSKSMEESRFFIAIAWILLCRVL